MRIDNKFSPANVYRRVEGRVAPPLIMWFLGVPGGVCILLWLFFFRGR